MKFLVSDAIKQDVIEWLNITYRTLASTHWFTFYKINDIVPSGAMVNIDHNDCAAFMLKFRCKPME